MSRIAKTFLVGATFRSQSPCKSMAVLDKEFRNEQAFATAAWSIRLPMVQVVSVIEVITDPKVQATLVGDRRQAIDEVVRLLERAKSNQTDGLVEVDERHVGGILRVLIELVPWMRDLLFHFFKDDEQN